MGDRFIFQIIANNSGIRLNVNIVLLQDPKADFWIVPIIQGFVQIEELVVNYSESSDDEKSSPETPSQEHCVDDIYPRFIVAIISRRSRHRAGMETITFEGQDASYNRDLFIPFVWRKYSEIHQRLPPKTLPLVVFSQMLPDLVNILSIFLNFYDI